MQNLNTLFNLVKQAAPVVGGSQEHQDLVGKLDSGAITQLQFDNSMLGLKERKVTTNSPLKQRGSDWLQLELQRRTLPITLDPYTSSDSWMNKRYPGFWEKYENLLKDEWKLNNNPLGPGLWSPREDKKNPWDTLREPFYLNPWNNDKEKQNPDLMKNPFGIDMDELRYYDEFWKWYNKEKEGWWGYRPGADPMWESHAWKKYKDEFMKWKESQSKPVTPGSQLPQLNPWERNKDLERYYDEFWKWYNKEGLWTYKPGSDPSWEDETWRRHKDKFMDYYNQQPKPVTPGSPEHQKLVDQLNKGEITKDLFNELMNGKPQAAPLATPQPNATPAPQPAAQQPSTPSIGSAIGKSTYNPSSITKQMMNKYRKYTSAGNMNSDMDKWKTWQASQGNHNTSNADYYAAKKNNFM